MPFIQQHTRKEADDAALVREYKESGQLETLAALYERYMDLVYGVCLKYLDEDSAKDAVMQIFEELIGKVKQHEIQSFRGWLHVLARNHCLMKLRAAGTRGRIVEMDDEGFVESGPFFHPDSGNGLEDNLQAMERCMEHLPEEQKKSVDLFYLQEKSYREVAEITGYDMNKVKSYIQNGKRNLKICMEKK
ncbi:RNA polymerase sigma factor [Chitinophaga rhizosphaerae]|uniref:RNA polymerase sigma factor n=1 Tax=Chitinophaga rhizosphaerae TaxID=1864947 RepID=UPI000F804A52|nr:sigma-70 family RNA polymerase sigma factor [Chitinophaga rhizosphaerae]